NSLEHMVNRLLSAGYSFNLLVNVLCQTGFKVFNTTQPMIDRAKDNRPTVVIPYLHGASHHLLKIASKLNVHIVFSVKFKLSMLTPFTYSYNRFKCLIKHRSQSGECFRNVVYQLPLACGAVYIGETGRCLTVRLNEH